jgi:hypothetical protein
VFWGIFTAKSQNPQGETAITADAQSYMRVSAGVIHFNGLMTQSFFVFTSGTSAHVMVNRL